MTGTWGGGGTAALQQQALEAWRVAVETEPAVVRSPSAFEDVQLHVAPAGYEAHLHSQRRWGGLMLRRFRPNKEDWETAFGGGCLKAPQLLVASVRKPGHHRPQTLSPRRLLGSPEALSWLLCTHEDQGSLGDAVTPQPSQERRVRR
jgi:hypothetical protein